MKRKDAEEMKVIYMLEKNYDKGVCYAFCFMPVALYVYGWFAKEIKYDLIEIFVGDKILGKAQLQIEKSNVLLHYGNITNNMAGWRFFYDQDINVEFDSEVKVVATLQGKRTGELTTNIMGMSVEESLRRIKVDCEGRENLLAIPCASNKIPMLRKISDKLYDYNFVTLIEAVPEDIVLSDDELTKSCEEKYGAYERNNLIVRCMPLLFFRNKFLSKYDVKLSGKLKRILQLNLSLIDIAEVVREKFPNMKKSYSLYYVSMFYLYMFKVICILKPKAVLLWNQFSPLHSIIVEICKSKKVPIIFSESGVLPGTLAFEKQGQMGESYPAIKWNEFKKLEISANDIALAAQVRNFFLESRLNRWSQYGVYKRTQIEDVKQKLYPKRPVIFYAGQNDYESGIRPYTENTKKFHSPIFNSSYDAAIFLAEICKKHKWNFIYKRHPMMRIKKSSENLPNNVINYDEVDIHDIIDLADVTVTILSQTAYVALIRKKPVVMLGYNQLRGKECTYEAFRKELVEKVILDAVNQGYTNEQEKAFVIHIAQLNKYYLYEDFTLEKSMRYAKTEGDLAGFLREFIREEVK